MEKHTEKLDEISNKRNELFDHLHQTMNDRNRTSQINVHQQQLTTVKSNHDKEIKLLDNEYANAVDIIEADEKYSPLIHTMQSKLIYSWESETNTLPQFILYIPS